MKVGMHKIYDDEDGSRCIATIHPASEASVKLVLEANINSDDGRSEWVWLRLSNGDLTLSIFPQGETYMACEEDAQYQCGPLTTGGQSQ